MVWLYAFLLKLLPSRIKDADAQEMAAVFAEQWSDAGTADRRRRVAIRAFGRLPLVVGAEWRDELRTRNRLSKRRGGRMENMVRVTRQAGRSLTRSRVFSLSVVLLLGLGVGSVSAIFAIVDHVLLRALPYPESDRLVLVQNGSHSGPAYEDFQELRSVEFWSAISTEPVNVTGDGAPARALEARVSERFFEMFGARPALGRLLAGEDAGVTDRIVLSYGAWLRFFGGEPSAIGRETRINGDPVQIVGVLGERFHPPEGMMSPDVDFYRPVDFTSARPGVRARADPVAPVAVARVVRAAREM
jgi:hypothetical protein